MNKHIGVRYVYEQAEPSKAETSTSSEEVIAAAIKALPGEWLASLSEALLEGDLDLMTSVVEEISTQNAPLASAIKACLDNFEFDKVFNLIQE